MAKSTISVPSRLYTPGTRTVNLPDLTTDDNGAVITMSRESWPLAPVPTDDILSVQIDGSNDGGATWFNLGGFSCPGGDLINPWTHLPVTELSSKIYWPSREIDGVDVPQRPGSVRATFVNTVALQTAITLAGL